MPFLFQQVEYVPKTALKSGEDFGVSLLDPDNRLWFVQIMACIRAKILTHPMPEAPVWESNAVGKKADPSNL